MPDDPTEEAEWQFYDEWEAFPLVRIRHDGDRSLVGRLMLGLYDTDGGCHGEFSIALVRFGSLHDTPSFAARLEVYGDAWQVLDQSGLVAHLAALDGEPTKERLMSLLAGLGYRDRTEELHHDLGCPTCRGKGTI